MCCGKRLTSFSFICLTKSSSNFRGFRIHSLTFEYDVTSTGTTFPIFSHRRVRTGKHILVFFHLSHRNLVQLQWFHISCSSVSSYRATPTQKCFSFTTQAGYSFIFISFFLFNRTHFTGMKGHAAEFFNMTQLLPHKYFRFCHVGRLVGILYRIPFHFGGQKIRRIEYEAASTRPMFLIFSQKSAGTEKNTYQFFFHFPSKPPSHFGGYKVCLVDIRLNIYLKNIFDYRKRVS